MDEPFVKNDLVVTRMTPADINGAIDTIQQAFADDPYSRWIFDQREFSPVRNRVSLTHRCHWGIKHGLFYVCRSESSKKILGCAMWLPPRKAGQQESWAEWCSAWLLWLKQGWMNLSHGRGGLNVARYWAWKGAQAEAQKAVWTDPNGYYFCNIVTVLPEAQGRGVGRALMEVVLERADREGRKCYLESSRREPNVGIYERFGFGLVREMGCEVGGEGVRLYCMVREPGGKIAEVCGSEGVVGCLH
ncbi:acetyltransferas-like protein [Trichodelitschia bisporula]|uniref:Acetyltransferas-like protein n=1 Tax=Trichodelitschia bisporula TaxID=703511 RepID=A0A6G1HLA6_9PEZI|nr:acetyltransferas-like protein [Trichodelitschia bisporula]